ncbi:MAG: NAD(P)/FAD-dependent oxidoreductase [Pirellulaceae bacterium]|nr:NAD(P)/FAD-dependent oxidoreductase [Pirellulaceae bacterium]
MTATREIRKIAVVGAGVAGLAAARCLSGAGFDCVIFEKRDRVGGVWAEGYHSFGLQTPKSLYEIPDYPMPKTYPRFPPGEQIRAYLENYARDFGLIKKIRFNTSIQRLERHAQRNWCIVTCSEENPEANQEEFFDFVVIATGLYSTPYMPEFPNRKDFGGNILHSSQYTSPDQVMDKKVTVVGFGKSALDIATDAAQYANHVDLVFRGSHWPVPTDVLGLVDVRRIFVNRLVGGFLPLYQRPEKWESRLHDSCPWLIKGFWKFVEVLLKTQFPLKACNAIPDVPLETDLFNQDFLPRPETYGLMKKGKIACRRATITSLARGCVELDNGQSLASDTLILATGWKPDYSWLPEQFQSAVQDDGVYLYRHIIHPELDNCAFIGWASTFSNSLTSHLASVWLTHLLTGTLSLPKQSAMEAEIQQMMNWKRSFMPFSGSRGSLLQLHMGHFHDELVRDIGISPWLKSNPVFEWLQDYRPVDYRSVLDLPPK